MEVVARRRLTRYTRLLVSTSSYLMGTPPLSMSLAIKTTRCPANECTGESRIDTPTSDIKLIDLYARGAVCAV